jgi:D-ribose pyranose/furanose isomerase RbsD
MSTRQPKKERVAVTIENATPRLDDLLNQNVEEMMTKKNELAAEIEALSARLNGLLDQRAKEWSFIPEPNDGLGRTEYIDRKYAITDEAKRTGIIHGVPTYTTTCGFCKREFCPLLYKLVTPARGRQPMEVLVVLGSAVYLKNDEWPVCSEACNEAFHRMYNAATSEQRVAYNDHSTAKALTREASVWLRMGSGC